jgi:hypothetical protein
MSQTVEQIKHSRRHDEFITQEIRRPGSLRDGLLDQSVRVELPNGHSGEINLQHGARLSPERKEDGIIQYSCQKKSRRPIDLPRRSFFSI